MKALGWILLVVGAGSVAWAFKLQSDANGDNAVSEIFYGRTSSTAAPWVFGIGGGVLALVGLVLLVVVHAMKRPAVEA